MAKTVYVETTIPNAYASHRNDAASVYRRDVTRQWWAEIDYLLTWNVRHLANPNKVEHMTIINRRLGLLSPVIISPDGLWIEDA